MCLQASKWKQNTKRFFLVVQFELKHWRHYSLMKEIWSERSFKIILCNSDFLNAILPHKLLIITAVTQYHGMAYNQGIWTNLLFSYSLLDAIERFVLMHPYILWPLNSAVSSVNFIFPPSLLPLIKHLWQVWFFCSCVHVNNTMLVCRPQYKQNAVLLHGGLVTSLLQSVNAECWEMSILTSHFWTSANREIKSMQTFSSWQCSLAQLWYVHWM